jgi:WD40 repeat protein
VAWSPDGTRLASAGNDREVRIWDPVTGTAVGTLSGHTGGVWAVAWSPDGTRPASAGDDQAVRITPIDARRAARRWVRWLRRPARLPVGSPLLAPDPVTATALSFAPTGALAAALTDGSIAVLPTDPTAPQQPVTRLLGLPDAGWAVFYGDHRYRLVGEPAGRFWWTAGLCRFEPGELDGYGVERLDER